jgi:hypothetical protein
MTQLPLPFLPQVDETPPSIKPSPYRRRLARLCGQAYALGQLRAEQRHLSEPPAKSLGAAAVAAALDFPRLVYPSRADRNEIALLARRLARLSPSHRRDPEAYFVEKDSIVRELRRLSK